MKIRRISLMALMVMVWGCAVPQRKGPEAANRVYLPDERGQALVKQFAPAFLSYGHEKSYNRIGRPSARYDDRGSEEIFVDPRFPAFQRLAP